MDSFRASSDRLANAINSFGVENDHAKAGPKMMAFFGGPVQMGYPVMPTAPVRGWADRAFDLIVGTFGNTGSAILVVFLVAFSIWLKFGRKK